MLRSVAVLGLLLFSYAASAGVFIEPYVGYVNGDAESTAVTTAPTSTTLDDSSDIKGVAFGGKLGLTVNRFAMGVDYMHSGVDSNSDGQTVKLKNDDVGAFLSIPIFYSFRLNGTYFFNAKSKSEDGEYTGTGYKAGVAFNLFWLLYINFDHIEMRYDDATEDQVTFSDYNSKMSANFISLSIPLGE